MGNSLEDYRASIGRWAGRRPRKRKKNVRGNSTELLRIMISMGLYICVFTAGSVTGSSYFSDVPYRLSECAYMDASCIQLFIITLLGFRADDDDHSNDDDDDPNDDDALKQRSPKVPDDLDGDEIPSPEMATVASPPGDDDSNNGDASKQCSSDISTISPPSVRGQTQGGSTLLAPLGKV